MRTLLITQWFDPEPHFKGLPFAQALRDLGHEVQVLTGFPNYPGGKVYPGYQVRLFQREVMDGIPVLRVPLYPSHDSSSIRRVANYASFAVSAATLGTALTGNFDAAYVYHAPATLGLPAVAMRLFRGIPFVYDINDLWPDSLVASGMMNSPATADMVDRWCKFIYRQASRITVVTPGFKERLLSRGVPAGKVEVIYNWCVENQIERAGENDLHAEKFGMSGRFNVVFAGNMGKVQALDAVLRAAEITARSHPGVQYVFIGGGVDVERLKAFARELSLFNVRFLPRVPLSEIGQVLNLADVLLVHLKDDPLFRITIPSKTQAYMAAGKPIIVGVRGDASDLVTQAGAGVACTPEDPLSIAQAVSKLYLMPRNVLLQMGHQGRVFYNRELALPVGARRFARILEEIRRKRQSD